MLQDIKKEMYQTEEDIKNLKNKYEKDLNILESRLQKLRVDQSLEFNDYNLEKIELEKSLLKVEGIKRIGEGGTVSQIDNAIKDITLGCEKIKKEYFGCKDYDRWSCQAEDHNYGYGPRHGSIVFEIGLNSKNRRDLTPEEIDSCIYYLICLKQKEFRNIITNT